MKKFFLALLLISVIFQTSHAQNLIIDGNSCHLKSTAGSPAKSVNDSLITALIPLINADSIERNMRDLEGFGSRFMCAPNHKDVALWLQQKFLDLGYTNAVLDSFQTIAWPPNFADNDTSWQYNVIATLEGSSTPDLFYITGAHYDSYIYSGDIMNTCPGADDDGSGTAAILEIARVFKQSGFVPAASIRFICFAAEEMMFYSTKSGSGHYVDDAVTSNEKIGFCLVDDMSIANNKFWTLELYLFKITLASGRILTEYILCVLLR